MRFALRSLLKTPGFTATAILTLALGIGVNTSMFSVLDALLFRSAPYPEPQRIVQVAAVTRSGETRAFSALELQELQETARAFAATVVLGRTSYALSEPGQPPVRAAGALVTEGFFATFGLTPMLGRSFAAEEYEPGRNQVVLLSHAYWSSRYGASAGVLGQTIRLDGENCTIIGVLPPAYDYRLFWGEAVLWRPLNFTPDQLQWRDYRVFSYLGRLAPGASAAQVAVELAPVADRQAASYPESYHGLRYVARPLQEALMESLDRQVSWMLLALAVLVLLIACGNLASLQLARASGRLRDVAIRAALGASRMHLMRQQLQEALLLAVVGAGLAVLVATALNAAIERGLVFAGSTGGLAIELNGRVLLLTATLALATGLIFGLLPAWVAARTDVQAALKQQTRSSSASRAAHRLRQGLIILQIAVALTLLGGAAVFHRGFAELLRRPAGWDTTQILSAALPVPETRITTDAQRRELYQRLEERLQQLPGVEHAALATSLPVTGFTGQRQILVEGQGPGDPGLPTAFHVMVTSAYFSTLGIPLRQGRLFATDIEASDPRVIVINESLARRLWPKGDAIGQRIGSMDSGQPYWAEVIGVVGDVADAAAVAEPATRFQIYKPLVHEPWSYIQLVVRSPAPASLSETLRRAVAGIDPDLAVAFVATVPQQIDHHQHNLVMAARTLTAFSVLGLALAALGLYGVIAHLVILRTHEFGVRLALGARPRDVLHLVLRHGMSLVAWGTLAGLVGAFALTRVLQSIMPRLARWDPLALSLAVGLLAVVALLACWWPARRATRVDPLIALQAD